MGPADSTQMPGTLNGKDANGNEIPDVIIFNDGQNYHIMMNCYYKTSTNPKEIRDYPSLQTIQEPIKGYKIGRPYANGYFSNSVYSAMVEYNADPDCWTSTNPGWVWTIYDYSKNWWDTIIGSKLSPSASSISQDCYADSNGYLIESGRTYRLGFWAKGGGAVNYPKATVEFFYGSSSTYDYIDITSSNWQFYTLNVQSPNTPLLLYAKITFKANPGGYAYISTTDFGIPGGIS